MNVPCLCPCSTRHPGQIGVCALTTDPGKYCEPCTKAGTQGRRTTTAKTKKTSGFRRSDYKPVKGSAA